MTAIITLHPYSFKKQLSCDGTTTYPKEVSIYLGPSEGIDPKSEKILAVASTLDGKTTVATVNNILSWMKKNLHYKIEVFNSAEEVLSKGYGECGGWSLLFTALCRARGIPARQVWGVVKTTTEFAPPGHLKGHVWAEIYLKDVGWIPLEPQAPEAFGMAPTAYVRMCHYDVNTSNTSTTRLRPVVNMLKMGGDTPRYKVTQ